MNQDESKGENASTLEKLKEIDERIKRAGRMGIGAALLAMIVAITIYAVLKSIHPRSTQMDIILLLWNAVIIAAPLVGVWVYKKNK